jgi:hypothetical protein
MFFRRIIKNISPMESSNTLGSTSKAGSIADVAIDTIRMIPGVLVLFLVGGGLWVMFPQYQSSIGLLLALFVLLLCSALGFQYRKYQAIKAIPTNQPDAHVYAQAIFARESISVYQGLVSLLIGLVATIIAYISFIEPVMLAMTPYLTGLDHDPNIVVHIIFVLPLSIAMMMLGFRFLQYLLIHRKISFQDNIAEVERKYRIARKTMRKYYFLSVFPVMLGWVYLSRAPKEVMYFTLVFIFVAFFSQDREIKQLKKIPQNKPTTVDPETQHPISPVQPNERIIDAIYGIQFVVSSYGEMISVGFSEKVVMGVGKDYYPENTLIRTTDRLLFVQAPMPGGNAIIGQLNFPQQHANYNRGGIKKQAEQLMQQGIEEVLKYTVKELFLSELDYITIRPHTLIMTMRSGKNLSYKNYDPAYKEQLKQIFGTFVDIKEVE